MGSTFIFQILSIGSIFYHKSVFGFCFFFSCFWRFCLENFSSDKTQYVKHYLYECVYCLRLQI